MSSTLNIESLIEMVGVVDHLPIGKYHDVYLFPVALPHLPKGVVGHYGYRNHDIPTYLTQHFFMTYKGQVQTTSPTNEIEVVKQLGDALEAFFSSQGCKVCDIQLPLLQGFSGKRHTLKQVRELTP